MMDLAIGDIFSPLRGDVSLTESTYTESPAGTPVLQRDSLDQLLQKKHRESWSRDSSGKRRTSDVRPGSRSDAKPGLTSYPSIEEENVFEQNKEMEEQTPRGAAEEVPTPDSGLDKSKRGGTPQGVTKRKQSTHLSAVAEDNQSEKSGRSNRSSEPVPEMTIGGKKIPPKRETENSSRHEERRKSRNNKSLESEMHSLKNRLVSVEESLKSSRLAVSMEFDNVRSFLLDVSSQLNWKLNTVLEEAQKTRKTNEYLLSVIEKQNEVNQKLLCALLTRNRLT